MIKLKLALVPGWKATENARFGEALVIQFCDSKQNDKVLFEYSPKLDDEEFWKDMWNTLKEYDEALVQLKKIISKVSPETNIECKRLEC